MSDYINREQAFDAVKTYWKKVVDDIPKGTGFEEMTQSCDMALEHNANILKAIKQLPSAQQWIPCSERLPEDGEEVLASTPDFIYITLHEFINNHHWWSEVAEYRLIHNVIAWMPLPEPYKGGDTE